MDSAALVGDGRTLVQTLWHQGMQLQAAAWLHSPDKGWRFIIVPRVPFKGPHEVYTRVSKAVRAVGSNIPTSLIEAHEPHSPLGMELSRIGAPILEPSRTFDDIRIGPYFFEQAIVFKTPGWAA